jgi:hypothetical protein
MAYDNNTPNNRNNLNNNYEMKNKLNESEEQRTRRQNRIGVVILAVVLMAFIGGYIATMDKRDENGVMTPTTALNTTPAGTGEAAITPSAGNATATAAPSSGDMTGTGVNSTPEATGPSMAANANTTNTSTTATGSPAATTATSGTTTEPVTQNPKVYTSEDSCRSIVGGACQPVSGGWTPVNPAPDKTAVPENVAPAMTATSPSDSSTR